MISPDFIGEQQRFPFRIKWNEGEIFFRNIGTNLAVYTVSKPKSRQYDARFWKYTVEGWMRTGQCLRHKYILS
jgi:hypothetical protein